MVMGYGGLDDLIDGEGTDEQSNIHLDGGADDYDFVLMCKQFASIMLGSSPPVELYCGMTPNHGDNGLWATKICREFLSSPEGEQLISPDSLYETWHSLYSGAANMVSTTYIPDTLETETRQNLQFTVDKPSNLPQHGVKQNDGLVEVMLDQSISFIPGLSKRNSHQLENCGFHTVRLGTIYPTIILLKVTTLINIWYMCRCGNCCSISLGHMLICKMHRLELRMGNT